MRNLKDVFQARPVLRTLCQGVYASMYQVWQWQWREHPIASAKADGTFVTQADLDSESAGLSLLSRSGLDLWSEEAGHKGEFRGSEVILFDPLDGTTEYESGSMTSTVSASIYNLVEERVTDCIVGEPASGRIWCSARGLGVWRFDTRKGDWHDEDFPVTRCRVSTSTLSAPKSTVYLDLSPTFKKGGRYPDISREAWGQFFPKVFALARVGMHGTNCGHHALVANGAEGAVGAITTAVGGPWDVAPVMMVLEAGGSASAISTRDGIGSLVNPVRATDYNFVVTGNSVSTVDQLSDILVGHLREYGIVRKLNAVK